MKQIKRMVLFSLLITIVGFSASLTLKVGIGVAAWEALAQSLSYLSAVKVGTIGMVLNICCVFGQWILLRKDFQFKHLLQLPVSILMGMVINFFFYDVLASLSIDNYILKIVVLLVSFTMASFAIGAIMVLDIVTFALEGFCMALSKKLNMKFAAMRQAADIVTVVVVILLTIGLSLPLTLREGTIIGMLFFSPMMGFFMKKILPIFKKLDLLPDEAVVEVELINAP